MEERPVEDSHLAQSGGLSNIISTMFNTFIPRPSQQNILRYDGGRLGIAAVPGAGKTHILSARKSINR